MNVPKPKITGHGLSSIDEGTRMQSLYRHTISVTLRFTKLGRSPDRWLQEKKTILSRSDHAQGADHMHKERNACCCFKKKKKKEKVFCCQLMAARHLINICARAWRCEPLRCKRFWSCSTTYLVKKQSMGLFTKWPQPWGIPLPRWPCGATSAVCRI